MARSDEFERYFHRRAELAEKLFRDGWRDEAYLVATVALDALAAIWVHDSKREAHPETAIPPAPKSNDSALRLNSLLDAFAPDDAHAPKVAVVLYAEDMLRLRPALAVVAQRLLNRRLEDEGRPEPMSFRASPASHLDCSIEALAREAPELDSELLEIAEHYRYPAFTYRFLRSSTAHAGLRGDRVDRFAGSEPEASVDYFPAWTDGRRERPIGLGVGLGVITTWVRSVVSQYVQVCPTPADGFQPSKRAQEQLDRRWNPERKNS